MVPQWISSGRDGRKASTSWRAEAAVMLFTDGLTERRPLRRRGRLGFDELVPQIDAPMLLDRSPDQAIDSMLAELFPDGTDALEDDLAVILLALNGT